MRNRFFVMTATGIFIFICLIGCRQNKEISENDFVGTWVNTSNRGNNWKSFTLNRDGTAELIYWNNNTAGPCTWTFDEDHLVVSDGAEKVLVDLKYKFRNDTTLVLTGTPENLVLTGDGTYIRQ